MGYYTRILTPTARVVSLDKLRAILKAEAAEASLEVDCGNSDDWTGLILVQENGAEIAAIEWSEVGPGTLGQEEIEEFLEEIEDCKPATAAKWLCDYLPSVKVIYAFQWLYGAQDKIGRGILGSLMIGLHKIVGGVLQADDEGFSDDEQGDHILWQFSEGVKGPWRMAVLRDGKWARFEMQLGNQKHREAFLRGEIPAGVKVSD